MEVNSGSSNTTIAPKDVIESPLVINKLQERSLKEVVAKYADKQLLKPSLVDLATEAMGLTPNMQVQKSVKIKKHHPIELVSSNI